MSNYIRDIPLTVDRRLVWKPARSRERVYNGIIQKSPTSRARCRKCSQLINKADLRFGLPIKHQAGEHGWISAWQHLGCTRMDEECAHNGSIFGYDNLAPEEQSLVVSEITSELLPDHLKELDPDDLVRRPPMEEMEPPTTLLRPLLRYQKEGLRWMMRQEERVEKGGILADEMGMGKTIQMIALILAHRVNGPTLVVCPVSSMMQWEAEIREHVVPNTLSVVIVYRTTKVTREALENADVVLTTYPMLEQAWRQLVNRIKLACEYCGLLFIPRQLRVHNKYFCGPRAEKTMKQLKREKNKPSGGTNRRVQAESTIRKGLRTLHVELDEDETGRERDTDERAANGVTEKRGVVGPIGMYQELMREAGRRVRSRWERPRSGDSSSSSIGDSSSEVGAAEVTDDSSESSGSTEGAEVALDEARDKAALAAFRCEHCGFQLLRYPFCPLTGQHHVLTEEMKETIETDTGGDNVDLSKSIFHSVKWARVILDEAHRIKGRTTSTARSAFALTAEYRWCLTGTPLQNRVGDVYSLLRFMRIAPYARYYCGTDGCSCTSLSHPFSGTSLRQCVFCGHGPLQHYAYFNKYVLNPISRYGYVGDGRKGMMMLTNDVFDKAMLRRTKVERAADLHLPSLHTEVYRIRLTREERNFYESLYKKSASEFDTFVSKGTVLHNYAHIFQLLSRLRQALDHPLLVMQGMELGQVVHAKGLCGVCTEGIEHESAIAVNPCKHVFHRLCLGQFLESTPDNVYHCPTCFVRINVDLRQFKESFDDDGVDAAPLPPELEDELNVRKNDSAGEQDDDAPSSVNGSVGRPSSGKGKSTRSDGRQGGRAPTRKEERGILSRLDPSKPIHGTKLDAIADYIGNIPVDDKVIVFSQFGAMLDLTQYWLQKRHIKSVKLTGSLTLTQRQSVLQAFLHDAMVRVILISLKAGGEGLNLQVANHVVLIDPWWNPAVEMQAVQRAHRIGQSKPVHAVRFVTENSVEERMVDLQDKKMLVFEGTVDGKLQSLQKLAEEDLQFLFTR